MSLPYVSCICPTYGRYPDHGHLLAEAVASFLRQDYPMSRRQLVVVNDAPQQELFCAAPFPDLRILNLPFRIATLGAKYNYGVGQSWGDVILPWEDDDLALPHRIRQAVHHLGDCGYWNPHAVWYWQQGREPRRDHGGVGHNASAYTRAAWLAAGGYPCISGAQDAAFDSALRATVKVAPPLAPDDRPAYIYRWGVSPCHVSGSPDHDAFYRQWGERPVASGRFEIVPRWRQDYEALLPAAPL
jgi:hypothetical protein